MNSLRKWVVGLAVGVSLSGAVIAHEPIVVVTSFSILSDMAKEVGGDKVEVYSLVGANDDAHVYQPRPADNQLLRRADVFVSNGLEFEGWIDRLLQSSGFSGVHAVATDNMPILLNYKGEVERDEYVHVHRSAKDDHDHDHEGHDHAAHEDDHDHEGHDHDHAGHVHGEYDPHAWHHIGNAYAYVNNIKQALIEADPAHADHYETRAEAYLVKIHDLEHEISDAFAQIPLERRSIVSSHEAFAYLGYAYEINFLSPQGLNTEADVSAADFANIIRQIREQNVTAIVLENVSDDRLVEQIGRETNAKVIGKLYSDALSTADEPASSYLEMMRHNVNTLVEGLKQ